MIHGIHWFPQPGMGRQTWISGCRTLMIRRAAEPTDSEPSERGFEAFSGSIQLSLNGPMRSPLEAMTLVSLMHEKQAS